LKAVGAIHGGENEKSQLFKKTEIRTQNPEWLAN
jgi:hypothetical protein